MMVARLLVIRGIVLLWIVAGSRGDSIGGMTGGAKPQASLHAGEGLAEKPVEPPDPAGGGGGEDGGGACSRVVVAGDSGGGTMAAVVAVLLRDKGEAGLAGQILIYPVTAHYDPPTASYLEMAEGYGLTRKGMMWFWDHYLNRRDEAFDYRAAPLPSPSLRGLPRAFVVTAEYDVLRDEGQAYAKRLEEAGGDVTHVFAE